jgi:transcriptional regulator with XRE-family HTH domain
MLEKEKKYENHPFCKEVRKLLKNVDTEKVADELGVTTSTFRQWVNGYTLPTCEKLELLADYFGVSTDYLLGRSKIRKGQTADVILEKEYGFDDDSIDAFKDLSEPVPKKELEALKRRAEDEGGIYLQWFKQRPFGGDSKIPFLNSLFKFGFIDVINDLVDAYFNYSPLKRRDEEFTKRIITNDDLTDSEKEMRLSAHKICSGGIIVNQGDGMSRPHAYRLYGPEEYLKSMMREEVADKLIDIIKQVEKEAAENG